MDQLAASKWPIFRYNFYRGKADKNKIDIYVNLSNMKVQLLF